MIFDLSQTDAVETTSLRKVHTYLKTILEMFFCETVTLDLSQTGVSKYFPSILRPKKMSLMQLKFMPHTRLEWTICNCLSVKELLDQNKHDICKLCDGNGTQTT